MLLRTASSNGKGSTDARLQIGILKVIGSMVIMMAGIGDQLRNTCNQLANC